MSRFHRSALRRLAVASGTYASAKRIKDWVWLRRHRRLGTYSQFGEDVEVLRQLGAQGLYIDVGSNHPYKANSTYLLYLSGWRGLVIEPIPAHIAHHRSVRPGDHTLAAAAGARCETRTFYELNPTGFSTFDSRAAEALVASGRAIVSRTYDIEVVTVEQVWRSTFGDRRPDFLSVDTEGFEAEVLEGGSLGRLRPSLVLLELTSSTESRVRDGLVESMDAAGYELVGRFGVNGLFAPSRSGRGE